MNQDFLDMLASLLEAGVRFLVVGAHAMAVHGVPRATGDLDLWLDTAPDNVERAWKAIVEFGVPVGSLGVTPETLSTKGQVIQLGLPPTRIDLLTELSGTDFEPAWSSKRICEVSGLQVPFIDRATLITNKRATGRTKDLADLEALGE